MSSTQDFFDILQTVTIDCKDNGECFTVTDRVAVIERMLTGSCYRLVAREPLALLYAKRELCEGDRVLLISSHIDCLYGACFCNDEGDCLRGTFDNSFSNAALLWNMLNDRLPDNVVVAFTGNEESDSQGAVQTVVALGRMGCEVPAALVLDVTNEGWESGALFTLENDLGIDMQSIGYDGPEVTKVNARGISAFFKDKKGLKAIICAESEKERYLRKSYNNISAKGKVSRSKINIMTVYESKGLEFSSVVVIPQGMSDSEKYIAYTRALKDLAILE